MENYDNSALPEDEKNRFKEEYNRLNLPTDLEKKIFSELRARKAFDLPVFQKKPYLKTVLVSVSMALVFLLGYQLGTRQSSFALPSSGSPYLLLLSNPSNFIQGTSHAKEYGTWFRNIHDKNAQGEELKEEGWIVRADGDSTSIKNTAALENHVSGYFIVNAASDKEALSIAASCPHLQHNGIVTVRPIQQNP
jgi:hypothetical protein